MYHRSRSWSLPNGHNAWRKSSKKCSKVPGVRCRAVPICEVKRYSLKILSSNIGYQCKDRLAQRSNEFAHGAYFLRFCDNDSARIPISTRAASACIQDSGSGLNLGSRLCLCRGHNKALWLWPPVRHLRSGASTSGCSQRGFAGEAGLRRRARRSGPNNQMHKLRGAGSIVQRIRARLVVAV